MKSFPVSPQSMRLSHRLSNKWGLVAALSLLLGAVTNIMATGYALAGGLSANQQHTAQLLARDVPWWSTRDNTDTHPLGLQTLSVEIQEQKNRASEPLVRVYQYHYDYQNARMLVFDLTQSQLISERSINTVHLPLNDQEIQMAVTLLSNRENFVEQLRAEQRARGKIAFQSLNDLDTKASIFEPMDDRHPCARQRCALMSLFDETRTVFSIEPIINLQTLRVELLDTQ